MGRTITTSANKVLPKAGLNFFDWAFVQGSIAVILLNFCAKNPRLRQYPNRYLQFYPKNRTMSELNKFYLEYGKFIIHFENIN
ncbi:hypothetical protein, partial [Chryseobacterium sp. RR2-3-20]|uniref:hypothetical protein n=1 Tax=Chryseobacterium sp. RR2-3-20 TaxID=2787626 RepID=UPI001ADEC4A6